MRRAPPGKIAACLAAPLLLLGCDVVGDREAAPLDTQLIHPGGVVLQVLSVRTGGERTEVAARIINGRDREIDLNGGREQSYLLTDAGEKLMLVPPATNSRLSVPAGQTIDATLIFAGEPGGDDAVLILNERSRSDNVHTNSPRFEARVPMRGAGGGSIAEQSALSGMRPNAASALSPRAAGGSGLAGTERSTSELRAVEALKTELGAVETERGTMVSLAGDVTFDFDKATIRQEARATLERLAELILASGEGTIAIEGHTDSRGEDAYNQRLSEQRAEAVATYLSTKGVSENRLQTRGFGESRPVADNERADGTDNEAGRQRNRRVEVVLPDGAQGPANGEATSRLEPVE